MSRAAPAAGLLVPVIAVLLVGGILFVPISPIITGTFTIQTTGGFQPRVEIGIVTAEYSRVPVVQAFGIPAEGEITLPVRPSEAGTYTFKLDVSYGNRFLLTQNFQQVGDGTYGFKIAFRSQQEYTGVPYLITITVSGPPITQPVSVTLQVFP